MPWHGIRAVQQSRLWSVGYPGSLVLQKLEGAEWSRWGTAGRERRIFWLKQLNDTLENWAVPLQESPWNGGQVTPTFFQVFTHCVPCFLWAQYEAPGAWSAEGLMSITVVGSQSEMYTGYITKAQHPGNLGWGFFKLVTKISGNPCVYVLCPQIVSLKWEL